MNSMRIVFMFVLRVMFLPLSAGVLVLSAAFEFMSPRPDWAYWRRYHAAIFDVLPWASYK